MRLWDYFKRPSKREINDRRIVAALLVKYIEAKSGEQKKKVFHNIHLFLANNPKATQWDVYRYFEDCWRKGLAK